MNKEWSKKELTFLKENAGKILLKDIATKLGKTISAVQHKSSRLKLNLIPERIQVKCSFCEKTEYRTPYQLNHQKKFFCDKICEHKFNSTKKVIVKCLYCGKPNKRYISRINDERGRYCDIECYRKSQRIHYTTELDERAIVKEYVEDKKTGTQIAKKYGCDYKRIYEILAKNNISLRTNKDYFKGVKHLDQRMPLPVEAIIKKYLEGLSTYDLAIKFNCSSTTIKKRLIENNVKIRNADESFEAFKKSEKYPEHIRKMKERVKLRMSTPEMREFHRQKALDMIQKGKFKQANTLPERLFKAELIRRGFVEGQDFIHQYLFGNKFSIDFAFPKQKILIEVQGDYWHGNLGNRDWVQLNHTQWKDVQRDINKRKYIKKYDNGTWILKEFWESDIKKNVGNCVEEIENILKLKIHS